MKKNFLARLMKLFFGNLLFAVGIVVTMQTDLGYAPWDVFHAGISKTTGIPIGTASIIVGVTISTVTLLFKEKIGLGTILNIVLVGVMINLFVMINPLPKVKEVIPGVAIIVAGLFIVAFASYFYFSSGFGMGPRDSLMVVLVRRTKLPVGVCRGILEGLAVLVGWLLGGPVGIGTIAAAFGISLCVQLVFSMLKFDSTSVKHENIDETFRNSAELFKRS